MAIATTPAESPFDRRRHPDALLLSEWRAPDGWPHRAYRWPARDPARPRGSLLFQSGRADFIEKYLEACDHWWRAGWTVEGFDWRGQGGSGRLFPGRPVDDRPSFDPLVDDLAAFVAAWRARTPAPHVLVAHSMGGHVALRLCAERGVRFDAMALVAPMLGLNTKPLPAPLARAVVTGMTLAGLGRHPARRDNLADPRRQARLTADRSRYTDSQWWKTTDPALALGPPSWTWLSAALAGAAQIDRRDRLETVTIPILMLVAGRDRLVDRGAITRAVARLPDAAIRLFPTAAHELLREADANRLPAMAAIDAFLDDRAPAR